MKIISLSLFVVLITCLSSFAQEKVDTAVMSKIRREGMTHSQVRHIAHLLTEVAGPRLTNSPGYKRASQLAVAELKKWGLVNATTESYGEYGKGWELEKFYLAIKTPYYQSVVAYPYAYSSSTNGLITAPVIVINMSDTMAIAKNKDLLKGKIVLLSKGDTTLNIKPFTPFARRFNDSTLARAGDNYNFDKKMVDAYIGVIRKERLLKQELMKAGAVAILRQASGTDGTAFVDGLYEHRKDVKPGLPEVALAGEEFLKVMRMVRSGRVEIEMEVRTKFFTEDFTGYNVVAEIAGYDAALKSEVVMLGGHLDSWHTGTGAADDGAGCIVMMEAVRILKALNMKPRRTIRIALWGGEEQGILGSIGYVRKHFGDPTTMQLKPEQQKISAYFNIDNGTGKIRGVYLQKNEQVASIFKKWLEPFADLGATAVTLASAGGTDHLSFDAVGVPGFQFIQDPIDYSSRVHHSNMDTYDHLLFDDLKQASIIVAAFVYNTAMRGDKLPRKPLPKPGEWLFDIDLSGVDK